MPAHLYARLDAYAERNNLTRSGAVVAILTDALPDGTSISSATEANAIIDAGMVALDEGRLTTQQGRRLAEAIRFLRRGGAPYNAS
jgi:predicted transcriptional regulator